MLQDRVIGILDWELSTLGNQMCDVAYNCLVCKINCSYFFLASIIDYSPYTTSVSKHITHCHF